MATKDTPAIPAGRSDPAAVIQGIPGPRIKRALEWIERLLTSVKGLKDRAEKEQSCYAFLAWGLDRTNAATAKAVMSSLKSIGYPGEAARIRSLHNDLARTVRDMLVRSDPAYVPVSQHEMAYLVAGGTTDAANLERALLEVQTVVSRDAEKQLQANLDGSAEDSRQSASAKLSPRELASKHAVGVEALRKRLDRWRYDHDAGYVEVSNPTPREPKYLYDESAVMSVIEALKAKSAGRKRAANGQRKKR